jgi:hypothetical protein
MMSTGPGRGGRVPRLEKPLRYAYDVGELKRAASKSNLINGGQREADAEVITTDTR